MNIAHSIPATVNSISFSFLSTEDVRRISVKQILNPVLLDDLNRPNAGGLYDPALGPSEKQDMYVRPIHRLPLMVLTFPQLRYMSADILHMPRALWTHRASGSSVSPLIHG